MFENSKRFLAGLAAIVALSVPVRSSAFEVRPEGWPVPDIHASDVHFVGERPTVLDGYDALLRGYQTDAGLRLFSEALSNTFFVEN